MNVWLVSVGEPLPIDGDNVRLMRTGTLARQLVNSGNDVTWWTSTFDHRTKTHRFKKDVSIDLSDNFRLVLLKSFGYSQNISLRRVFDHKGLSIKFAKRAKLEPLPDVIISSMPIIELCHAAEDFVAQKHIPLIVDMRDMWPDIYFQRCPKKYRWLLKLFARNIYKQITYVTRHASAISGITDEYVDWGLGYAGREATQFDRSFPLAYTDAKPSQQEIDAAMLFWEREGIVGNNEEFVVCLFTNMSGLVELGPVIEVAKKLESTDRKFRFVFCGGGEKFELFREMAKDCPIIHFPGWVDRSKVWSLMRIAKAGLVPLRESPDFAISLPNKTIEYMSAGLPIISSLTGKMENIIASKKIGISYKYNNNERLSAALTTLYDNRSLLEEMSSESYKLFKSSYLAEKVYAEMVEHIYSVVRAHKNICN